MYVTVQALLMMQNQQIAALLTLQKVQEAAADTGV